MGKTIRRKKNFNTYEHIDSWFNDFEHDPFEISDWMRLKLRRQLSDIKIRKNYIHSDCFRANDPYKNFVQKESNKKIRNEKRQLIHKLKKDEFTDTPNTSNRKNNLYRAWIY